MSRQVFKYVLEPRMADGGWVEAEFEAPVGSGVYVHTVADQFGRMCLWMDVDSSVEATRLYRFVIVPTGGNIPEDVAFIGTVLMNEGSLVWHVFQAL